MCTGKVEKLDKASANYLSLTGNFDKRVELDARIRRGDIRYKAAISAMASKASYENEAYIKTTVQDHWKVYICIHISTHTHVYTN